MRGGEVVGFRDLLVGTERATAARYTRRTHSLPRVPFSTLPPEPLAGSRNDIGRN